jgi:anti-sigma factor RsiW
MSPHCLPDDAWLALQYVLGELSPSEQAALEIRLSDDPALCQQVADATLLLATLQAAEPVVSVPAVTAVPADPPRRRLAAVICVAAAALCLVLAVLPREEHRLRQPGEAGAAAKLVGFWRGHAGGLVALSDDLDDDHADWSNDQVPGWMIAAVSLEQHRKHTTGENTDDEWEEN